MRRLLMAVLAGFLASTAAQSDQSLPMAQENIEIVRFAGRVQEFDELVFRLAPGDYKEARMMLRGLDVLSGEISDYRIRTKTADPAVQAISDRILKLRQDILKIESASPEAVAQEAQRRTENLQSLSWDLGNLEDRAARLAIAAEKAEERTRLLSGKNLDQVREDIGRQQEFISEGLLRVSEANSVMSVIHEKLLASPGIYEFEPKLIDKLSADRRLLDDMQSLLIQRKQTFSSVANAIGELTAIDQEVEQYPTAYAQIISNFRAHLILSSPEAFSVEMRQAHNKLREAERMIEDNRRSEATALLVEAQEAYDRWAPTYQKAEELYLAAKAEHDRVDALGARRTALYAFLFQTMAGSLRDPDALEKSETRGIKKYLRAVEPLHDDFVFFVDRYQTVAETWSYVGGAGLQKRLQALMIDDAPASSGRRRVVQK